MSIIKNQSVKEKLEKSINNAYEQRDRAIETIAKIQGTHLKDITKREHGRNPTLRKNRNNTFFTNYFEGFSDIMLERSCETQIKQLCKLINAIERKIDKLEAQLDDM